MIKSIPLRLALHQMLCSGSEINYIASLIAELVSTLGLVSSNAVPSLSGWETATTVVTLVQHYKSRGLK